MKLLKILTVLLTVLVVGINLVLVLRTGEMDTTPPEITVPQDVLEVSASVPQEDYLQGVTAWDNRDGDITDQVLVEHISQFTGQSTVKVTYGVFDRAGNSATATRTVRYTDYQGPRFQLSKPLRYGIGQTVTLMDRLTAWDETDGEITNKIRVTSLNLSNDLEGIYRIRVQVTNSLGDTQVQELPVLISDINAASPVISLTDYIVYVKKGEQFAPEDYLEAVTDPATGETLKLSTVEIQSQVDTKEPGTYDVLYSYEDGAEKSQVLLTVVVVEQGGTDGR